MNLVIDVGNTLTKLGVFDLEELKLRKVCAKEDFLDTLGEILNTFPNISRVLVASVGKLSEDQISYLQQHFQPINLDQHTPVPFTNKYGTPHTLGVDRIAVVSAAAHQFPDKNVLIIDAGSCITYDFKNSINEYLGGAISPGIGLRYRALHSFTENLPLLQPQTSIAVIGDSTASCMHSGVVNGILFEIDGFIDNYRNKYAGLTVILTGGDAHFLRDRLKNDIFANANFLLVGLNQILEYNSH